MYSYAEVTENKTLAAYTYWDVALATESANNFSLLSGGSFVAKRSGLMNLRTWIINNSGTSDCVRTTSRINTTDVGFGDNQWNGNIGYYAHSSTVFSVPVVAGNLIKMRGYSSVLNPQTIISKMWVQEVITW
jgi:hypothetical protein